MNDTNKVKFQILYLDVGITTQIGGGQYFDSRLIEQLSNEFKFLVISNKEKFYSQMQINNYKVIKQGKLMKIVNRFLDGIYTLNNRMLIIFFALPLFIIYSIFCSRMISKLDNNFDLILSGDGYYQGEFIGMLSRTYKKPFVHILNTAEPTELNGVPGSRIIFTAILKFFTKIPNLNFIALNNSVARVFENLFPGKSMQIPVGVNTDEYTPCDFNKKDNYIIYVGRLDEGQKNISLLIESFALIKDNRYSLIIAGTGNDFDKYSNMISELNLTKKCYMTGNISTDKKIKLLSESKIFVNPSVREGQSSTVLEAMSCGTAVVCVKNEGSYDTIIDGYDGILVDNDKNSLKLILEDLMNNDQKIRELSLNARKNAIQKYSIINVAKQYEKVFKDLLERTNEST